MFHFLNAVDWNSNPNTAAIIELVIYVPELFWPIDFFFNNHTKAQLVSVFLVYNLPIYQFTIFQFQFEFRSLSHKIHTHTYALGTLCGILCSLIHIENVLAWSHHSFLVFCCLSLASIVLSSIKLNFVTIIRINQIIQCCKLLLKVQLETKKAFHFSLLLGVWYVVFFPLLLLFSSLFYRYDKWDVRPDFSWKKWTISIDNEIKSKNRTICILLSYF